jgi:predicted ATP-binding protein involved in virulence
MFRLEYLKLNDHPQLGNLELFLSEKDEIKNVSKPYTSVIIGPNGTGKSYILKTISDIFRQFNEYSETEEKKFNLPFDVHLRYRFYQDTYEIVTRKLKNLNRTSRKEYLFYKNRPNDVRFYDDEKKELLTTGFEVMNRELEYPEKLLVNSTIPTDRFVYKDSNPKDFYQYLGARSSRSTTSTKSTSKRTVKHLFNATALDTEFKVRLKELLQFLEFEESFKVNYKTRFNSLFFSGNLTKKDFKKFFEEWWDPNFKYTDRKQENPLWSIPYYNNNFKNDEKSTDELIRYLNLISSKEGKLQPKANSSSKAIMVDLMADDTTPTELSSISHLENLDIINLDGIKIKKADSNLSISDLSSGEYHLIVSLIGIFATIKKDSLILIDEPEISLHPNWQMRYVSFLKDIFSRYASCQFILTTHSHFIVSDLEGNSSSVTSLKRDSETHKICSTLLKGINTFGWAAEDVLYKVFDVRTTRNYYTEVDMRELLYLISEKHKNKNDLRNIINRLESIRLSEIDPLNLILKKAQDYMKSL